MRKKQGNKYKNKKVKIDGITFDSAMEGKFYKYLKEQEQAGKISKFLLQPKFELLPKFTKRGKKFRAIEYKADFHILLPDGTDYVVDVKGFETADFKLKKKMFEYKYPQELKLITWSNPDGGWIELEDLKKARKLRKKLKEEQKNAKAQKK